jgi:hypothetical protein
MLWQIRHIGPLQSKRRLQVFVDQYRDEGGVFVDANLQPSAMISGEIAAILNPGVLTGPTLSCYLSYRTTASGVDVERNRGAVLFSLK